MTNDARDNELERHDAQDDTQVATLRQLLMHEESMPLGLTARLQAHVQRNRRIGAGSLTGPRVVIAAAAFATAAFRQELAVAAVGLVVALCYAMLLDFDAEERGEVESVQ